MISKAAIEAVTNPDNMTPWVDGDQAITAVDEGSVVDELRRLDEALSVEEARRMGREAVAHLGGQVLVVHSRRRTGRAGSRGEEQDQAAWWVPNRQIRA